MKILIVDDEEVHRKAAADALEGTGCEILSAKNGVEALDLLGRDGIGVVLLDIIMPGLHGLDVLNRVKEMHKDAVVIMMAAPREHALLSRAMDLGAFDFVRKPLNKEDLSQVVRKALTVCELNVNGHRKIKQLKALETGSLKLAEIKGQDVTAESFFDSSVLLQTTLNLIADVLEAEKVSLMIVDERRKELRFVAASGFEVAEGEKMSKKIGEGIAGMVAEKGEPLLVRDIDTDPRHADAQRRARYKTASFICAPLKMRGRTVGVISVNDKKTGEPFNENDLSLLLTFTQQIALTIENAIIGRDLKRHSEKLSLLTQISRILVEEAEPRKVYREIARLGQKVLDAEAFAFFLLDESSEEFVCRGGFSESREIEGEGKFSRGEGILGDSADDPAPVQIIDGVDRDPRYQVRVDRLGDVIPRALLTAPVRLKDRVLGLVAAANKKGERSFASRDAEMMESLALSASMALKNAWLHDNLVKTMDEMAKAEMELERVKAQFRKR